MPSFSMIVRRSIHPQLDLIFVSLVVIAVNDLLLLNEQCHPIVDANKEQIQKWSKEGTYPAFVCDQMKKLPVNHAERVQTASKILYLHYLIAFFKRSIFKRLTGSEFDAQVTSDCNTLSPSLLC